MENRKIFDHLHKELSVLAGEFLPRMPLWGEFGGPPSKEAALLFLREKAAEYLPDVSERKIRRLIKRFERWDPDQETPEEVLARIFGRKDE